MKRKHNLGPKILILSATVPLLIFACLAISLISYLAFNLDAGAGRTGRDSGAVRIRTIPNLELVSPAPVTNEPELHLVGVVDDSAVGAAVEPDGPPAAEATAGSVETPTDSLPALETRLEPAAIEPVLPDPVAAAEVTVAQPQYAASPPVEEIPAVEVPVEPAPAEQPLPEPAANPPLPPNNPPVQIVPSEPSFVPDSSFFDQLLEQVD